MLIVQQSLSSKKQGDKMKLFIQTIMATALLATSNTWGNSCNSHRPDDLPNPRYRRTIVIAQDRPWPGPVVPLDPNHQAMINSGLYTQADADQMTNDAIEDVLAKFGIDFRASNPNVIINPATGIRTLPGLAVFLPIVFGVDKDFFLISDSAASSRGSEWYDFEVGQICTFIGSGTFTEGTFAGSTFQPNDLCAF